MAASINTKMRVHWRQSTVINDSSNPTGLCLSVASSIGIGVFLIVGYVAKHVAGPATIVSVLIAAAIAILTGKYICLCVCVCVPRITLCLLSHDWDIHLDA